VVTVKNILGIIGIAVIALFWVVIVNVWGGLFVAVLVVLAVLVLNRQQRRKRAEPRPKTDDSSMR
jgi:membrane protein implicated in regulation of membrane protease activity